MHDRQSIAPVARAEKTLLRFLTCGSVDDGKSTLIGHLLYAVGAIYDDQIETLRKDTRRHGTVDDAFDFALLLDGLEQEREQGITIDVAYRYFSTPGRKYIVADTPGHEQYTRNMVTGASNADAAIVLIDARKGVLDQTRRHSIVCSLLGIRSVAVAVNKIDLVEFSKDRFEAIAADYRRFAAQLEFERIEILPISARFGDNLARRGDRLAWFEGPTLLDWLETVEAGPARAAVAFRLPVQTVIRPDLDFRGFAGTVAAGTVRPGDRVVAAHSGRETSVRRIVTANGDRAQATAGDAVTLLLEDEIDLSRGDVIAAAASPPEHASLLAANLVWMAQEPLIAGRPYLLRAGTRTVAATVTALKHRLNIHTLDKTATKSLAMNEIGYVTVECAAPIAFDAYRDSRATGGFILIDRESGATCGAGMIVHGLRRATNVSRHSFAVDKAARARIKGQRAAVVWFTGLSGSGKSTVANVVESRLHARGHHTMILDGDNMRHGLNRDLGFTPEDRVENIRRVGEVAKLFAEAGTIVLCCFISPYRADRRSVRDLLPAGEFLEVFVDAPVELCAARDPKGLYAKARQGGIPNFTGVSAPYEAPEAPELTLDTARLDAGAAAAAVIAELSRRGILSPPD